MTHVRDRPATDRRRGNAGSEALGEKGASRLSLQPPPELGGVVSVIAPPEYEDASPQRQR